MTPELICNYPCLTCRQNNRKDCTSCVQNSTDYPAFLMPSSLTSDGAGKCVDKCDFGFTRNGDPTNQCRKCDESCFGCKDDMKDDDVNNCINCA